MSFIQKPKRGFVLGKFMPPQKGHVYMCDFGQNYVEELTILVCSLDDEPIPGRLRFEWMKTMFPNCRVLWCDERLPQYPEESPEDFWEIWNGIIRKYHPEPLDVVFASESYGARLAKDMNAQFVPVDLNRDTVRISATSVRSNPSKYWKYIPDIVKPYFVKRVCMFGPESTGKSTLAKVLAEHYETTIVPEYGRIYTEFFGADVNKMDMQNIVAGHMASVQAAKKQSGFILIEDTDPVMSAVWSEMLLGERDVWFDNYTQYADLYLLCDIDIPWVDDGTRYFPQADVRAKFFQKCEEELIRRKVKYIRVKGSVEDRKALAIQAIDGLL